MSAVYQPWTWTPIRNEKGEHINHTMRIWRKQMAKFSTMCALQTTETGGVRGKTFILWLRGQNYDSCVLIKYACRFLCITKVFVAATNKTSTPALVFFHKETYTSIWNSWRVIDEKTAVITKSLLTFLSSLPHPEERTKANAVNWSCAVARCHRIPNQKWSRLHRYEERWKMPWYLICN